MREIRRKGKYRQTGQRAGVADRGKVRYLLGAGLLLLRLRFLPVRRRGHGEASLHRRRHQVRGRRRAADDSLACWCKQVQRLIKTAQSFPFSCRDVTPRHPRVQPTRQVIGSFVGRLASTGRLRISSSSQQRKREKGNFLC